MISQRKTFIAITLLGLIAGMGCYAQSQEKIPYYISINNVPAGTVYDIWDNLLHVEYEDAYGATNAFTLNVYDWKRKVIAAVSMDKSAGVNNYTIKLDEIYNGWQLDKTYTAELKDEGGTLHRLPIRIIAPPEREGPAVDIMVNPLQVTCDEGLDPSLVEFYGTISGGKAPYTVNWFVLNSARTDFLYQPREETILMPGKTVLIKVDRNPAYYVVLYVKDACGGETKRIVNMVCADSDKKINTIFVEELESPLMQNKKIIR